MRTWIALPAIAAALLAGAATAFAAPKDLPFQPDAKTALELCRTRGKLILLTVIVDNDESNRAVIDTIFRDAAFRRIADEFVLLYANPDYDHGKVKRRGPDGKMVERCADCPSIRCEDHNVLAHDYSRAFYPTADCRTPVHFVIDRDEHLVEAIYNGDMATGLDVMPVNVLVERLKKILDEHGRGLTDKQYEQMQKDLVDARAARARDETRKELDKLLAVAALEKDVVGVRDAKARMAEIDSEGAGKLAALEEQAGPGHYEEVLDALEALAKEYKGLPCAEKADARRKELSSDPAVRDLLKARELYEAGVKFVERKRYDLARKKFEEVVRRFPDTPWAAQATEQLAALD